MADRPGSRRPAHTALSAGSPRSALSAVALAVAGLLLLTLAPPAGAADTPRSAPAERTDARKAPTPARPRHARVTLVTGDIVSVTTGADGREHAVLVPDPGDPVPGAVVRRTPAGLTVVPREAVRWLSSGRLDPDLFNVTKLIREGYDDARAASLPLLVRHDTPRASGAARAVVRQTPAGAVLRH
ncbi:MAG: hypothetical protein M3P48_07395, partial [Actinomycetota bacterium]|nr:hypothetical protein [Actinomycetota bacterium]